MKPQGASARSAVAAGRAKAYHRRAGEHARARTSPVEEKRLFGSEFYFSGPPTLARQAHAYVTKWLAGN